MPLLQEEEEDKEKYRNVLRVNRFFIVPEFKSPERPDEDAVAQKKPKKKVGAKAKAQEEKENEILVL